MKMVHFFFCLLFLLAVLRSAFTDDDSWELGTNDSIPKTEVILNPYGDECDCP